MTEHTLLRWRQIIPLDQLSATIERSINAVVGDADEFTGGHMLLICEEFIRNSGVPESMVEDMAFALWDDVCTILEKDGWPGKSEAGESE